MAIPKPTQNESDTSLETFLGEWLESKKPRSVVTRKWLADTLREQRAEVFREIGEPSERQAALRYLRDIHQDTCVQFTALEEKYRPLRERAMAHYHLWCQEPSGGIQ